MPQKDTIMATKPTKSKSTALPSPVQAAPAPIVHADAVKAIRKDRIPSLARIAVSVVDTVDTVGSVARAIRAGVDDAATVGRMDAAHAIHATADELTKAGADHRKVCAMKWNLLARVASAKRK